MSSQPRIAPPRNWALLIGAGLVGIIAFLALFGPGLAPKDPMQENFIYFYDKLKFVRPPYTAFRFADFPLGSDEFGRDVLSQLLWAVRPTLTLALVVGTLRILIGTLIGLITGWWTSRFGRWLESLITFSLSAPVMFVALCAIAATGAVWGVWAFILGLSITGWAETARIVREQTRQVKGQPFIEAAHALGSSDGQILWRHVLPQIVPLLWTLLAFEVSSAILITGGLGLLGYYINSIWVMIGDFVAVRASGRPELGQMLGGAANIQRQPWGVLASGGMIALMVLGFNLLGEGLRYEFSPENTYRRKSRFYQALQRGIDGIEDRLFDPLSPWRQIIPTAFALAVFGVVVVGGLANLWESQARAAQTSAISVPGGHLWAAEQHDAQATLWSNVSGPQSAEILWVFTDTAGLSSGPVVAADGTLYVTAQSQKLHALTAEGNLLWSLDLPAPPFGALALGPSGDIYVVDQTSRLIAVKPDGTIRWQVQADDAPPLTGPIISDNETVYFPSQNNLMAISIDGTLLWKEFLPTYSYINPLPRLSIDGKYLFFEDVVVNTKDGKIAFKETREPLDKYMVGANGKMYLRQQTQLLEWKPTEGGAEVTESLQWDPRALNLGARFPREVGVTPDGTVWVYYASGFDFVKVLVMPYGNTEAAVGLDYPYRREVLFLGLDKTQMVYVCGSETVPSNTVEAQMKCRANRIGSSQAVWEVGLTSGFAPIGGALLEGRMYVSTAAGWLYAIGEKP